MGGGGLNGLQMFIMEKLLLKSGGLIYYEIYTSFIWILHSAAANI